MADLTHLDSRGLQAFLDGDVADFITALEQIRKDDPAGAQALKSLLDGRNTPDTLQENPSWPSGSWPAPTTCTAPA